MAQPGIVEGKDIREKLVRAKYQSTIPAFAWCNKERL
jgi:hypothetical protein